MNMCFDLRLFPCPLFIFYFFFLHTRISSFIVFHSLVSFALLLPSPVLFPSGTLNSALILSVRYLCLIICLSSHSFPLLHVSLSLLFLSLSAALHQLDSSILHLSFLTYCKTNWEHQVAVKSFHLLNALIVRCCLLGFVFVCLFV